MFSENKISEWKDALEKEKVRLEKEIENLEKRADFGSDVDGFDEESDEAEELINEKGAAFTLQGSLKAVSRALEKMETDSYGICERCGNAIEERVLDAAPESTLCAPCKKEG